MREEKREGGRKAGRQAGRQAWLVVDYLGGQLTTEEARCVFGKGRIQSRCAIGTNSV